MHKALAISLLLLITLPIATGNSANALPLQGTEENSTINAEMSINLVMIGDAWKEKDMENIKNRLLQTYTPQILFENRTAGVMYNYTYAFESVQAEKADAFFKFVNSVAVEEDAPPAVKEWVDSKSPSFWGPEFVNIPKKKYKFITIDPVMEWLSRNLELKDGYTIYFLKPSGKQMDYWHTYGSITKDPDTGMQFLQEGMMGFGGKGRFYFIDLYAGPWLYPYVRVSEDQAVAQFHKNIYEVKTDTAYYDYIADYVNDAIVLLFTPSYLYSPIYKSNFKISIFLVDMTSGRSFRDVAEDFVDSETINHALAELIPYTQWSSEIHGNYFDILPRDLQIVILKSRSVLKVPGGDVALVRSADLITELEKWVSGTVSEEQLELSQEEAESTVFVPVVIFVFDQRAYVDKVPVMGLAAPDPSNASIPCCAIVAVDRHALMDLASGLSAVTIHEMGHVLGLRHPHDGYSPVRGEFTNWFFDWSYTPLSYTSPTGLGCGFVGVACGMVIKEFGQFDRDAMDRAMVLYLQGQVRSNLNEAYAMLEEKGYRSIPDHISSDMSEVDLALESSVEHFVRMNYFNHTSYLIESMDSMDDAFDFALKALGESAKLLDDVSMLAIKSSPELIFDSSIVGASGSELSDVNIGEQMSVKTRITNDGNSTLTFTYIVQVKDSSGYTLSLSWLDSMSIGAGDFVEQSISYIPESAGELQVEVFMWEDIDNPLPLSDVKNLTVTVN
jgi:hypothetical protein